MKFMGVMQLHNVAVLLSILASSERAGHDIVHLEKVVRFLLSGHMDLIENI